MKGRDKHVITIMFQDFNNCLTRQSVIICDKTARKIHNLAFQCWPPLAPLNFG